MTLYFMVLRTTVAHVLPPIWDEVLEAAPFPNMPNLSTVLYQQFSVPQRTNNWLADPQGHYYQYHFLVCKFWNTSLCFVLHVIFHTGKEVDGRPQNKCSAEQKAILGSVDVRTGTHVSSMSTTFCSLN